MPTIISIAKKEILNSALEKLLRIAGIPENSLNIDLFSGLKYLSPESTGYDGDPNHVAASDANFRFCFRAFKAH